MAKTDMLHVRIEHDTKIRVENTLRLLGLSVSDAICIFLSQVDMNGGIPFDVRLPRPKHELIAAAAEARRLGVADVDLVHVEALYKDM